MQRGRGNIAHDRVGLRLDENVAKADTNDRFNSLERSLCCRKMDRSWPRRYGRNARPF